MKQKNLKEDLVVLLKQSQRQATFSIGEILGILSGKGRILFLIFLSIPFCLPLQIPGLSIPFGFSVAFIGFRMAFAKRAWLPKRILLKTVSSTTVQRISQKYLKLMTKITRLIHPRLRWLSKHRIMHGLLFVLLGIFLALPLPIPLTNLLAGWAIFLLSIGLLEDDGVFILIGYFISFLTVLFFILIAFSIKLIF